MACLIHRPGIAQGEGKARHQQTGRRSRKLSKGVDQGHLGMA